jgi:hypothetical protein
MGHLVISNEQLYSNSVSLSFWTPIRWMLLLADCSVNLDQISDVNLTFR